LSTYTILPLNSLILQKNLLNYGNTQNIVESSPLAAGEGCGVMPTTHKLLLVVITFLLHILCNIILASLWKKYAPYYSQSSVLAWGIPDYDYNFKDALAACNRNYLIWLTLYIPSIYLYKFIPYVIYPFGLFLLFLYIGRSLTLFRAKSALKRVPQDIRKYISPVVWVAQIQSLYSLILAATFWLVRI